MPLASIHSTMAEEHGAQQACSNTSLTPSGATMDGFLCFIPQSNKKRRRTQKILRRFYHQSTKLHISNHASQMIISRPARYTFNSLYLPMTGSSLALPLAALIMPRIISTKNTIPTRPRMLTRKASRQEMAMMIELRME